MKRVLMMLSMGLLVAACDSGPTEQAQSQPPAAAAKAEVKAEPKAAPTPEIVQAAIEAADAARTKAASVGHEWRDTAKFITQARTLMSEGKLEEAQQLAEKAKREGELGYKQWELEQARLASS